MKIGFDFFETRFIKDSIDISVLEEKYRVKLPPIFKLFAQTFIIAPIQENVLFLPDKEVGFDNFIGSIEQILMDAFSEHEDDEFLATKLIGIATSGIHSGGICVGTVGEFKDKIILDTDYTPRFQIIANNIFEFVRGLKGVEPSTYVFQGNTA